MAYEIEERESDTDRTARKEIRKLVAKHPKLKQVIYDGQVFERHRRPSIEAPNFWRTDWVGVLEDLREVVGRVQRAAARSQDAAVESMHNSQR